MENNLLTAFDIEIEESKKKVETMQLGVKSSVKAFKDAKSELRRKERARSMYLGEKKKYKKKEKEKKE